MLRSLAVIVLCVTKVVYAGEGKQWALLVAGSYEWYNYRHQADVCHAYQILHSHGIPDEQIVVMMYDDIANNAKNPRPGVIINKPNGKNVYQGVPKDYTGSTVTPENFLNILKGNRNAMKGIGSGKVIDSGPDDHVFVYYADHGAEGLVAFPNSQLYANQLIDAIKYKHSNKQYKKMVFYIEACFSGSMFYGLLPDNLAVFATTAANPFQNSYACYCNTNMKTCLGDQYSVSWMENSDEVDLKQETLLQQYAIVKQRTTHSEVSKYGDMSFVNDPLAMFQGNQQTAKLTRNSFASPNNDSNVNCYDVPLAVLRYRLAAAQTKEMRDKINKLINGFMKLRLKINDTTRSIVEKAISSDSRNKTQLSNRVLRNRASPKDFDCYAKAVTSFAKRCFDLEKHPYALRQVYALSNLCEENIAADKIVDAIKDVCDVKTSEATKPTQSVAVLMLFAVMPMVLGK